MRLAISAVAEDARNQPMGRRPLRLKADVESLGSIVELRDQHAKHSTQAISAAALRGSSGAAGKRKLRLKTNFRHRINTIAAATSFPAKFPLAPSGKSSSHFRASCLDEEGRYAIVTSVGCGMRWTRSLAACSLHADERVSADGEVVWSWSPGAETKFAMVMTNIADDGGKKAGPRGDHV
jgi:hypothetical protein